MKETPLWLSILLAVVPIIISGASFCYTMYKDKENKEKQREIEEHQKELEKRQSDVEAIAQYRQVKTMQRVCKNDLITLTAEIERNPDDAETSFLTAYSSFTDLFNEANAFCSLINHNSVVAEDVLKNTGIDLLLKLADFQCGTYERLKHAAEKISTHKITMKRPDYNAFREYDAFLEKRMDKGRYDKLKQKRREVGLTL